MSKITPQSIEYINTMAGAGDIAMSALSSGTSTEGWGNPAQTTTGINTTDMAESKLLDKLPNPGAVISGGVEVIGSLFGGRKRRRRERKARKAFKQAMGAYESFDISNAYAGMTNPFESLTNPYEDIVNELTDLEVSTEAAEFQAQQQQQGLAQSLEAFRGAGGGTGSAALATALAQESRKGMQSIAADIARQEVENQKLAAQTGMDIQMKTAEGEATRQALRAEGEQTRQQEIAEGEEERQARELSRKGDVLAIKAGEFSAAQAARSSAKKSLLGGLGKIAGGIFGGGSGD